MLCHIAYNILQQNVEKCKIRHCNLAPHKQMTFKHVYNININVHWGYLNLKVYTYAFHRVIEAVLIKEHIIQILSWQCYDFNFYGYGVQFNYSFPTLTIQYFMNISKLKKVISIIPISDIHNYLLLSIIIHGFRSFEL